MLQHGGEKVDAGAGKLLFVKLHFHLGAAREGNSIVRHHARKWRLLESPTSPSICFSEYVDPAKL